MADNEGKKDSPPAINKGVELMLRRVTQEPKTHGLKINKSFTLQNKQFFLKFEFTWRDLT